MRELAPGSQVTQRRRDPRLVVAIIFPVGSIYLTNRPQYRQVPLVNSGFESGTFTSNYARGLPDLSAIQQTDVHSGAYAAQLTGNGVGAPYVAQQVSNVTHGQTYRVSVWIKRDESSLPTGGQLFINWLAADNTLVSAANTNAATGASGWQQLVLEATVPENAVHLQFGFRFTPAATGRWFFDDFACDRNIGIANVPGNVIHGALTDISSSSQALYPDDARATIGSLSFTAVDIAGAITEELREQLRDFDAGVRLREVRIFTGDTDDFNDFERVETYVVDNVVELDGRSYRFQCSDRTREQRVDIFERSKTRLDVTLSESETTSMTVQSTSGFSMLAHTASFSHRPNETVGYIRVRKTGEIIAYTGKTDTTFTGLERGCFGTRPQEVVVDPATDADKRPEIEEVIYLELPGPELDYAIMTGKIRSSGAALPSRWHMAIDESHVDGNSFDQIGTDLYDPDDVTKGFILRFLHEEKQDGKRFLEEQVRLPCGTVCVVDAMGRFVLRRMVSLISTASPAAILFDNNIIEHGPARYNLSRVINQVVFDWNYDGERYTRTNLMINADSVGKHQKAKPKTIKLRGLHVSRHSVATLRRIFATLTDRYGAPPIEMTARLSRSMNQLEIADVARVVLGRLSDHTNAGHLDRTFEIQRRSMNWKTGDLNVTLFGSTARPLEETGGREGPILNDAWYTSEGIDLASVLTISNGHVTANGTLTGGDDLRASVFYYDGDLTIDFGVTITISDNVQLRIKGELTVNGKIDGAGRGLDAIQDPNSIGNEYATIPYDASFPQYPQTIGSTAGSAGIRYIQAQAWWQTFNGVRRIGQAAVARPALVVQDGALSGIPSELRGTPGIYGAPAIEWESTAGKQIVRALGGDGGASGAGLAVVCRGLAFGLAGEIDLSGANGSPAASTVSLGGHDVYPGGGGGGAAGGLLVILDGDELAIPDVSQSLTANHGDTIQTGNPIDFAYPSHFPDEPWTGRDPGLGAIDSWEASHLSVHVPNDIELGESDDEITPAPRDLTAVADGAGVRLSWELPPTDLYDVVELFESIDNDRSNAVLIFRGRASSFTRTSDTSITRYYWVRARDDVRGPSEWEPVSATAGVSATFGGAVGPAGSDGITALPASFGAGRVGGASDFVFTPNSSVGGGSNPSEIRVQGTTFAHPDGTARFLFPADGTVWTPFGGEGAGAAKFWLMWTDTDPATRWGGAQSTDWGHTQIVPIVYEPGTGWRAVDDQNDRFTFTPLSTDCIIAACESEATGGVSRLVPLTAGLGGVTFSIAASNGVQFRQAPNGGAWSGTTTDVTFQFFRGGAQIAEHVVRVTRTNATLTAVTLSESGEPTTETIVGDGTGVVTIIVKHDASGVSTAQSVSAVQGGDQGSEGPEGPAGADGRVKQYVFRRSATQPATPTGNGVPSGWSDTPPAADGNPLWTSVALQELDGTTIGSWSTPIRLDGQDGATGAPGMNVARARIYRRSATTPTLPSATATFTFATGAITGLNNGWSATIPAPDGNPLWISEATAASSGATDTIASNEWASPVILAQDGADGLSVAELTIYRRSPSAPATPTGGSYNFATQTLTPPTNWSSSIPAGNDPIYASRAVAAVQGTSGTDNSLTWSTPVLITQEGSAVDIIFTRSSTPPSTPPPSSGVPSGWSSDITSAPGSGPLWSSVGTRPNAGSAWTWQTPIRVEGEPASDFVYNGGFERGNLDGWALNQGTVNVQSTSPISGTYSARFVGSPRLDTDANFALPVTPGERIRLSIRVRRGEGDDAPSAGISLRTRYIDVDQNFVAFGSTATANATTSGVQDLVVDEEVPAGAAAVQFSIIQFAANETGYWDVDDAVLRRVGDDGVNSATVFLYQRTTTNSAPSLPGSTLTYTFETGLLSGSLGSWSQTVPPDSNGAHLWVTTATALSAGPTDTIAPGEWAAVRKLGQAVTWRSGNGAPAGSLGNVGDFYLDEQTGNVYEKTGATTWTLRTNLQGPPGAPGADGESYWTPVLVNVSRSGKTFTKTAGGAAWNASVHSQEGFSTCHVSFCASQTNAQIIIGLNTDPTTNHSFETIDAAFSLGGDGTIGIYESGTLVGTFGAYTTSTVFTITYDGYHVRYWVGNTLVRTLAYAGQRLFLDSSFHTVGGAVNQLIFQPGELGQVDLATKVSGILSEAFIAAGALNENITINADGTLSGAGGGQVQIGQLPGSVAVGQLTTNILVALQAVVGTLSAIRAELGHVVISTDGSVSSGAAAYDGDGGWWLGRHGGEAALSMRAGTDFIRMKPSFGIQTSFSESGAFAVDFTDEINTNSVNCLYKRSMNHVEVVLNTGVTNEGLSSNNNVFRLKFLPPAIRPSATRYALAVGLRTSLYRSGLGDMLCIAQIGTDGVIDMLPISVSPVGTENLAGRGVWPSGTQTKSIIPGVSIIYAI